MPSNPTPDHTLILHTFSSSINFGEERNPILTLKTTYGNHGRRKNIARKLTTAGGLAFKKKRVVNRDDIEGVGQNAEQHQVPENVCDAIYYDVN
ncbi:hypothetical protein TNCV_3402741 [Trichonephila clavipes]|nr:hypothetical protein TNCV_3402741 [Trichonephila clavipes]